MSANRNLPHSDNWATPPYFYDPLNQEFNFDHDPCPYHEGEITADIDGLTKEWGERNFVNPPYLTKLKEAFVLKSVEQSKKGKLCVILLPARSTSTKLFHDIILKEITEPIRFVRGRIRFMKKNESGEFVSMGSLMHDSMLVIFDGRKKTNQ